MTDSSQRKKLANEKEIIQQIKKIEFPLESSNDLDPLMERIGDSKFVLLGEASHGTHEYYTWRTKITQRLILEKGFSFIGVEGDWPDCYKVNRYVKGFFPKEKTATEVLHEFNRWPTWMWANWEVVALVEWLFDHNKGIAGNDKIGFYGLDVYSLRESLEAVLGYLKITDIYAFDAAKKALECFEPFNYEGVSYARLTKLVPDNCENEVINLLKEIQNKIAIYNTDHETVFSTEQNAIVALHAEHYYREMVKNGPSSWNIRDQHMVDSLDRLMDYHGKNAKAIIWEHNSHIGDARATDMADQGMFNVGELVTKKYGKQGVVKVGFGSYKGSVIAGYNWEDNIRKIEVPEAKEGSWEHLLHRSGAHDKLLIMDDWKNDELFDEPIDHRAIGVVYNPEREQETNYVPSIIPKRYEAFIYLDETKAVHPLHIKPDGRQTPETYPWGV